MKRTVLPIYTIVLPIPRLLQNLWLSMGTLCNWSLKLKHRTCTTQPDQFWKVLWRMLLDSIKEQQVALEWLWLLLTSVEVFIFSFGERNSSIWFHYGSIIAVLTKAFPRTTRPSNHTHHENRETVIMPYLKPRDVLTTLLTEEPWLLLGGLAPGPQAFDLLKTFWRVYRSEHATHKVFQMEQDNLLDLSRTIPLMIHGDGGRTSKKQPLEVMSLIAVLGLDTKKQLVCRCPKPFDFTKDRSVQDPLLQKLNNRNNSYLSHFLLFAFPSKKFKKTPGLLKAMLRVVSDDIGSCCTNGIVVKNERWNFGVIGLRGDAEWHAKTGVLNRSYQNVGHKNEIPCCHLCDAGAPGIPFEDFRHGATWKSTMERLVPWNQPPPYSSIPFEPWDTGAAAKFFRYDPLHVFRLGIVRNFIASCLIMLCTDGYYDFPGDSHSVPERLSRAWMSFTLFCETKKKTPASLRSFSREKLHYATTTSFPFVGCKGSDSVLLLKYLQWFAGLNIQTGQNTNVLQLIKLGCDQGLGFQAIHGHGLWLPPSCRDEIYRFAKGFCHTYSRLAQIAMGRQLTLFGLVPKAHSLAHIYYELEKSWRNPFSINPAVWDTSSSEDFVGRVSRQSRRVGYRNIVGNTILAYRVKAKFVIKRFKKTRSWLVVGFVCTSLLKDRWKNVRWNMITSILLDSINFIQSSCCFCNVIKIQICKGQKSA